MASGSKIFQTSVLLALAVVLMAAIFFADINVQLGVAIGALYCVVVLYSWLLPSKFSSIYVGFVCTVLLFIGLVLSYDPAPEDHLDEVNRVISLAVIWICASLVALAKFSYSGMEDAQDALKEKVSELDKQKTTLKANKETLLHVMGELRDNEVSLHKYNQQLEMKNKELERFAYIAAHDLQEPMLTTNSFIGLIKEEAGVNMNDQTVEYLQYVEDANKRMQELIQGLLEFSRIGRKLELQEVDCQQLVKSILRDFNFLIQESGAEINYDELPTAILGYENELHRLFLNLLSNAIKFRKKDVPPKVHIGVSESEQAWNFYVQDNGIGIDKKDQEEVFMIFKRLHGQDEYEGTGIGLANCKKIVELHQGQMKVRSKLGEGTTFHFSISKGLDGGSHEY